LAPPLKVVTTLCQAPSQTGASAVGACAKVSLRTTRPVLSITQTLPDESAVTPKGTLKPTPLSAPPLPPLLTAVTGVFGRPVTDETTP
jgi:hypothetical protein